MSKPVNVFFGSLLVHLDEDQAAALLMRRQIIKCDDTRVEHYHLVKSAGDRSERGIAIDLRPRRDVSGNENKQVADMIERCVRGSANE